jgi:hypothetical protein
VGVCTIYITVYRTFVIYDMTYIYTCIRCIEHFFNAQLNQAKLQVGYNMLQRGINAGRTWDTARTRPQYSYIFLTNRVRAHNE